MKVKFTKVNSKGAHEKIEEGTVDKFIPADIGITIEAGKFHTEQVHYNLLTDTLYVQVKPAK